MGGVKEIREKKYWIDDLHLYDGTIEEIIRLVCWIVSWMGGILVSNSISTEGNIIACAYFIYSFSFLVDFVKCLQKKKRSISRIVYTAEIIILIVVICLAFCLFLMGEETLNSLVLPGVSQASNASGNIKIIMFYGSLFPICFLAIDTILWCMQSNKAGVMAEKYAMDNDKEIEMFITNMNKGNLGDIK